MDKKEFYTELIYRIKHIEDYGPSEISIRKNAWDLGLDELLTMFHGIAISATYQEESFINVLAGYLEDRGYTVISPEDTEKLNEDE